MVGVSANSVSLWVGKQGSDLRRTFRVSSGSQRSKSWYNAHSTHCTRFFWPWALEPLVAKVSALISGQSERRWRSSSWRLVKKSCRAGGPQGGSAWPWVGPLVRRASRSEVEVELA